MSFIISLLVPMAASRSHTGFPIPSKTMDFPGIKITLSVNQNWFSNSSMNHVQTFVFVYLSGCA